MDGKEYNRAAVFVFYDKNGIADDSVDYYLQKLSEHLSRLVIVCNGYITPETRALFEKHTSEIVERENKGLDAWGYKAGLEYIGWEALRTFDEVVLANDTVFGPIYPLQEMFDRMSGRGLDFWGVTKHRDYYKKSDFAKYNPYGYVPEHIQSYFIVYGNTLLNSVELSKYWSALPDIETWHDAIGKHETYFTKYFADKGYQWDVYSDVEEHEVNDVNVLYYQPKLLLSKYRMPFIKCKLFCEDFLTHNAGEQAPEVYRFLKNHTTYNEDFIWQKITRCYHQYEFVKAMSLTYVLPTNVCIQNPDQESAPQRIALIMHLFCPEIFEEALHHAKSMPTGSDIYISTDDSEKAGDIRNLFRSADLTPDVRIVKNRGRSESALLIGMRDVANRYNLICFWKEKRSNHISPTAAATAWSHMISENLLHSNLYVKNIIATFADNPRLGILCPPVPNHSILYAIPGREWGGNYKNVKALAERLGLNVPMSKKYPPITAYGGSLWFRSESIKKLFEYDWKYEDFPDEPIPKDGTILHAIERIYPYVAQDAGYYPAVVLTDHYASLEHTNLHHYLRSTNLIARKNGIKSQNYKKTNKLIGQKMKEESLKSHMKRYLKKKLKFLPKGR